MPITIPSVKVSLILKCSKWPWTDKEISLDNGPDTLEILTAVFSDHVHVIAYESIAIINASTINCVCHVHFFIGILYAFFFFFAKNQICIEIFSHQIELQGKGRPFLIGDQKGSLFQKGVKYWFFFSSRTNPGIWQSSLNLPYRLVICFSPVQISKIRLCFPK